MGTWTQAMDPASEGMHAHAPLDKARARRKRRTNKPAQPMSEQASKKPPFTPELIKAGLSQLGKTADGLRPAYLRLDITQGTDMQSTQELANYPDLQVLNLANNDLKDLSHLSLLLNLVYLDVSNNQLTEVLAFQILDGHCSNLRHANFAGNRITTLPDLSAFSRLTSLALDRNNIEILHGLSGLSALITLSLTHNRLRNIEGLEALRSLRHLNIQGNRLKSLEPLRPLSSLQTLNASLNQLTSLEGAQGLTDIQQLDVTDNALLGLSVTGPCSRLAFLDRLDIMRGNPVAKVMSCRLHLVHLLPQVAVLDGIPVAPNEKVHAANMHGAAAEALLAIRKKYFPKGELDDNGGTIPPPSAGLVASDAREEATDPTGIQQSFLRIDACVHGMGVPDAQYQAALEMLHSLAAGAADVADTVAAAAAAAAAGAHGSRCSSVQSMRPASPTMMQGALPTSRPESPALQMQPPAQNGHAHGPMQNGNPHPEQPPDHEDSHEHPSQSPQSGPKATSGLEGGTQWATAGSGSLPQHPQQLASIPPSGPALLALATQLASVCEGQLQLARACFQWVTTHTEVPRGPGATADVDAPLFADEAQELLLLGHGDAATTGTWAERAAWLFVQLARACELEAVLISGFWKGDHTIRPGNPIAAHNHCWAGVKVNGQWRLLDPTAAAFHKGRETPSAPFYVPPQAFIYAYYPLEDHWQLLPEPVPFARWWSLPHLSVGFLARGMLLLEALELGPLRSVNTLAAPREGAVLPVLHIRLAAPRTQGCLLRHSLRDVATGQVVKTNVPVRPEVKALYPPQQPQQSQQQQTQAWYGPPDGGLQGQGSMVTPTAAGEDGAEQEGRAVVLWPPPLCGSKGSAAVREMQAAASGALAFQQVEQVSVDSSPASHTTRFGANTFVCSPYSLVTSPPGPGEYELVVEHVQEVPGGLPVHVQGMDDPLVMKLEESEEVLSVKVIVPEVEPHNPQAGMLHETTTPPCLLPYTHQDFIARRVQLVSPPPTQQLQADRTYQLQVVVPGAHQVALLLPDGKVLQHLSRPEPAASQQAAAGGPAHGASSRGMLSRSSSMMGRGEHPERWVASVCAPRAPFMRLAMTEGGASAALAHAAAAAAAADAADAAPVNGGDRPAESNLEGALPHNASTASGPSRSPPPTPWVPLLTFYVAEQVQHMVDAGVPPQVPIIEPSQPSARLAVELFQKLDLDQDGKVSRKDLLSAVKKDSEIAHLLGLPRHISLADGTMDTFNEAFLSMDTSGLGTFTFSELCMRIGIRPESSFGRVVNQGEADDSEEVEEGEAEEDASYS